MTKTFYPKKNFPTIQKQKIPFDMSHKKSVVIGASPNPERYAYRAVNALKSKGHPVEAVGIREGKINDVEIQTGMPSIEDVDTVTLYVGPRNQDYWKDYIESLNPKRVIFNPGTENANFEKQLQDKGIETVEACTLVMLSVGNY